MIGPKPGGPTHPTPTHPPKADYADHLFAAVDLVLDDLQTPARQDHETAAAVGALAIATTGGPVQLVDAAPVASDEARAGGTAMAPGAGAGFTLPRPPPFVIGVGRPYDALPRRCS